MTMTLRQLAVFDAVAATCHFGRAADLLGISQPTVSTDIRSLERSLGLALFVRSNLGTRLTEAGAALLPSVRAALTSIDAVQHDVDRLRLTEQGILRVAATPSVVNRLLPGALRTLALQASGLRVEVLEVATGGVSDALLSGRADVGLGHLLDKPRDGGAVTIGQDALWVLTDRGPITPEEPVVLTSMQDRELLIWPRAQHPRYFDFLLRLCRDHGLEPRVFASPSRISGAYSYKLASGEAFSIVPEDFARDAPPRLAGGPIAPAARVPLRMVWAGAATPRIRELAAALRSEHRVGHRGPSDTARTADAPLRRA